MVCSCGSQRNFEIIKLVTAARSASMPGSSEAQPLGTWFTCTTAGHMLGTTLGSHVSLVVKALLDGDLSQVRQAMWSNVMTCDELYRFVSDNCGTRLR